MRALVFIRFCDGVYIGAVCYVLWLFSKPELPGGSFALGCFLIWVLLQVLGLCSLRKGWEHDE
jgi:hypothetical protein